MELIPEGPCTFEVQITPHHRSQTRKPALQLCPGPVCPELLSVLVVRTEIWFSVLCPPRLLLYTEELKKGPRDAAEGREDTSAQPSFPVEK